MKKSKNVDNSSKPISTGANSNDEKDFFTKASKYREYLEITLEKYGVSFGEYIDEIKRNDLHTNYNLQKKKELVEKILFPQNEQELDTVLKCLEIFIKVYAHVKYRTDNFENNISKMIKELTVESVTDSSKINMVADELVKVYVDPFQFGKYLVDLYEYVNNPDFNAFLKEHATEAEKNRKMSQTKFTIKFMLNYLKAGMKATRALRKLNPELYKLQKSLGKKKGLELYAGFYDLIMGYLNCFEIQDEEPYTMNLGK